MLNRPKPGGIRFEDRAYDAKISLAGVGKVRDLLAAVSRATGREILADLRVTDLSVLSSGGSVRAGDALGAVALAVTGTYRPVGPGFILASDLVGTGTRKAKIDRWQSELTKEVRDRGDEWRQAILKSGGMRTVGYPKRTRLQVDEEMQQQLDQPRKSSVPENVPTNSLPPSFREFLIERSKEMGMSDLDLDSVGILSEVQFSFVLPDGMEVRGNDEIPTAFGPPPPNSAPRATPPDAPRAAMPEGDRAPALLLTATSLSDAEAAVRLAETFGFRELWLETLDATALKAAIASSKRPVRLVVRPWTAPPGMKVADPDCTLFGDAAKDVVARQIQNPRRFRTVAPKPPTPQDRDFLAPTDPQNPERGRRFAALAQLPGLAGVVVLDSQPAGYIATAGRSGIVSDDEDFGYAESARWAFLKKYEIDPVDLVSRGGFSNLELRQPFFLDNNLASLAARNAERERPDLEGLLQAPGRWQAFRAEANQRAFEAWVASWGSGPFVIQIRRKSTSGVRFTTVPLRAWTPGTPLPMVEDWTPDGPGFTLHSLSSLADSDEARLRSSLANPENIRTARMTLDLSDVPAANWKAVLDRILKSKSDQL